MNKINEFLIFNQSQHLFQVADRPRYFGNEFHGRISREHSALLLRSDGEYLVRESVNEAGMYCLVMKINGCLKNYRLFFDGAHYAVGDQKKFDKLTELVEDGIIHMFIEHRAKNYIETMSKQSIYAQLKALQGEEIDLRQKASPYAEIPLDSSYMMSTTSSSGISTGSDGPIYEAISDDAESININQPNRTTLTLASKSSISNMSTGHASECSSNKPQSKLHSLTHHSTQTNNHHTSGANQSITHKYQQSTSEYNKLNIN